MAHNAKAGGEIGANGEFYKGGQFVADSANTVKGAKKFNGHNSRKVEVAPYRWGTISKTQIAPYNEIKHLFRCEYTLVGRRYEREIFFDASEQGRIQPVYEKIYQLYMADNFIMDLDEFIKEIGGEDYFYLRYCPQYLRKNYAYFDEQKIPQFK